MTEAHEINRDVAARLRGGPHNKFRQRLRAVRREHNKNGNSPQYSVEEALQVLKPSWNAELVWCALEYLTGRRRDFIVEEVVAATRVNNRKDGWVRDRLSVGKWLNRDED